MPKHKKIGNSTTMQEELKICKDRIYDMIEPYWQEDESKVNPSPLGGLKDLFVCSLETPDQFCSQGISFYEYINDNFLCSDEEVLAYFDCEQNISAFQKWNKKILYHRAYDKSFGYPLFLLLQKIRVMKDRAMVRYLIRKEKEDAYIEWIQSTAFFEICVREYIREIQQMIGQVEQQEREGSLEEEYKKYIEMIKEVYERNDKDQTRQWEQETEELFWAYFKRFNKVYYMVFFYQYCMELIQDLFASLRIIVLNEYMNIFTGKEIAGEKVGLRNRNQWAGHGEDKFWEKTVKRWLQDEKGMEFAGRCLDAMEIPRCNDIQNYKLLIDMMQRVCPFIQNDVTGNIKEREESYDPLGEYVSILKRRYIDKDSAARERSQDQMEMDRRERDEERLQELREQLAAPMWKEIRTKEENTDIGTYTVNNMV